jgi:hypothetical protein
MLYLSHQFHIMLFESLRVLVLLLLLLLLLRCLVRRRGRRVHSTENLALYVVDLWHAHAKFEGSKYYWCFLVMGCVDCAAKWSVWGGGWKVQSVSSFAPPCYCVGVNRFAIKSLLSTRCCKFSYIYNTLPGYWLVKSLYLVQSVARTV